MRYTLIWDQFKMNNDAKIIGVTGNIATGKSVLRRMLVNSGALGIDADELAHRMIYPRGPAFQAVVETFGDNILSKDGSISHRKLGKIVFNDPESLLTLEKLVHPFVIEAIHSHASADLQLERLIHIRNMTCREAKLRVATQPHQDEKIAQADVVINTEGSFFSIWRQVQQALNDTIYLNNTSEPQNLNNSSKWTYQSPRELSRVQLESFWQTYTEMNSTKLYENLSSHVFFPLFFEGQLTAIIIWENWNFTATLKNIIPVSLLETSPTIIFDAFGCRVETK